MWEWTDNGFYGSILGLMLLYLGIAYWCKRRHPTRWDEVDGHAFFMGRIYDAATFASSGMILLGVFNAEVLKIIGGTKLFLLIAGLIGMGHAMHVLFPWRAKIRVALPKEPPTAAD